MRAGAQRRPGGRDQSRYRAGGEAGDGAVGRSRAPRPGGGEVTFIVIPGRARREPGISRFRVWSFGPSRNDELEKQGVDMSDVSAVKALVFDVFGTVVDWRTSLIADFTRWADKRGVNADWTALVDGWRAVYSASMDEVRKHPERGYMILDTLHRQSLEKLVAQLSITGLTDADLHYLTMGWHRLNPWPDSVAGLTRLKTKYIISPLSNGNVALLTNMAKFAGLPWDLVMSAELFEHYKPDP